MAKIALATLMVLYFWASPAMAQQVLYCVDTEAVGFKWDKDGKARQRPFAEDRFTVKIVSDKERVIIRMTGDTAGTSEHYTCKPTRPTGRMACDEGTGVSPWVSYRNSYTRAYLAGPPAGGADQNIWMAYGTCTGF